MNIIGIYPGSFQPPHRGNLSVYNYLKSFTKDNTFIITSNIVEQPQSPLNFHDKQQIWTRHGVPIDKVVQSKDPYQATEIIRKFGSDRTAVIFALSKIKFDELLRMRPDYFKQYQGSLSKIESVDKVAFVLVIPDKMSYISGNNITGDTFRKVFSSKKLNKDQKKSFFNQTFGWYDPSLFFLIEKKFSEADVVKERISESFTQEENINIVRRWLRPKIKEIIGQLTEPQEDVDNSSFTSTDDPSNISASDLAKIKREKEEKKREELKASKKELDNLKKKNTIDNNIFKMGKKSTEDKIKSLQSV